MTQVTALMYQSQLAASMVAYLLQQTEQQFAHLASQQNLMHENTHQIIVQVNALSFNQSDVGCGRITSSNSSGCRQGRSRHQQGSAQMAVDGGKLGSGFVPATSIYANGPTTSVAPYQGGGHPPFNALPANCQRSPLQYIPPKGGYGVGGQGNMP